MTIFQHPMPPLHGSHWGGQQEISLVEVVTDEGVVGHGSACRSKSTTGPDGMMHAPTAPGLGVEIDWEWMRAHEVPL